jgi:hypothetical protein
VEPALVNEMFYQIPEILKYHEGFLKQLAVRIQDWSDNSKLGDIFVSSVSIVSFLPSFDIDSSLQVLCSVNGNWDTCIQPTATYSF